MADECPVCLQAIAVDKKTMEWLKTATLKEAMEAPSIAFTFKCPKCGKMTTIIKLVKPG